MSHIINNFHMGMLPDDPQKKTALLLAPPVYDTQYWGQWSQPYGLLRIAALLKKYQYKQIFFYDFLEVNENNRIHQHRINPDEVYGEKKEPDRPIKPYTIKKPGYVHELNLYKFHFGKSWDQFEKWLDERDITIQNPPDEIWISSIMTYWWESIRDLVIRLRNRFGNKTTIIIGGIYATLTPIHIEKYIQPDIIVVGEILEANDLWTDLSFYTIPPKYAIITPSRGCPYRCAYCAQKQINSGRSNVTCRDPNDIFLEMLDKWEKLGIRDFAFYADFLLWDWEAQFLPLLEQIAFWKDPQFRIYMPEGLDVRILSKSKKLVDSLKAARLQKIYLPCESIDDNYVTTLNRRHVKLEHFVQATKLCESAGFSLRNLDVNAFILYGMPEETIDQVVRSILFVSEIVGSIIPMLFTPVPTTILYDRYYQYINENGWDKDLHMLNGKLYPFIAMNEGSIEDYVDLQRLMFMLNAHYRNSSFQVFGKTLVSYSFRENIKNGFYNYIEKSIAKQE